MQVVVSCGSFLPCLLQDNCSSASEGLELAITISEYEKNPGAFKKLSFSSHEESGVKIVSLLSL